MDRICGELLGLALVGLIEITCKACCTKMLSNSDETKRPLLSTETATTEPISLKAQTAYNTSNISFSNKMNTGFSSGF